MMQSFHTFWLKPLMIALLLIVAGVNGASAQQTATPKEPGPMSCSAEGDSGGSEGSCNCREKYEGPLVSVIVPCIRDEVIKVTKRMTGEFAPQFRNATFAFLALVIAIFGVKILMAEGDPKKDGFILLVKIAVVIGFISSYESLIIDPAFGVMKQGVELTTSPFDISSEYCQDFVSEYSGAEEPWIHYDCVLGKLMGFGGGAIVGASALGLAGAALWSGQFGAVFLMGVVSALFFIMKLIIRGIYTYLTAVIALAVLIFISPLLIPLVWMPVTQQYFDRWLGAVTAMIIIPAIVMAYLTLAFMMLDKVFFDEDIGIGKLLDKDKAEELWHGQHGTSQSVTADPSLAGITPELQRSDSQANIINPTLSGSADSNMFSQFYHINFRSDEAGTAGKMFFGFVALILITYILMAMLDQVIALAQVMVGGGFFLDSAVSGNDFEKGLGNVQGALQGRLSQGAGAAQGGAAGAGSFVNNLATGITSDVPKALINSLAGRR